MKRKQAHDPDGIYPPWESDFDPAPGDLRIVQALINTYHFPSRTDELATPRAVAHWVSQWTPGAGAAKITEADRQRIVKARRGLYSLVRINHGLDARPELVADLDRVAAGAMLAVRFTVEGAIGVEPAAGGADGVLARGFHAAALARRDDRWKRMKICLANTCHRVYYDFSPNRSSKWCHVRCGNRLSARRYRRRAKLHAIDDPWDVDEF